MTKKTNFKQCNTIRQYKESVIELDIISEIVWQRWQSSYATTRRKIFLEILETGEKGYER